MVAAETSYMARGDFLDMEEGVTRQNHLEPRRDKVWRGETVGLEHSRVSGFEPAFAGWLRLGEVSQCAHGKSFSLFCRRVYCVLSSLDEHRCSRITIIGE
jgi:hypothetical protein